MKTDEDAMSDETDLQRSDKTHRIDYDAETDLTLSETDMEDWDGNREENTEHAQFP